MRAQYKFHLASEIPYCSRCGSNSGCRHIQFNRIKHFNQVRKLLVAQFGEDEVHQSIEGNLTVLTVN